MTPDQIARAETPRAVQWMESLDELERDMVPVFLSRGYSRDTALLAVLLMDLKGAIYDLPSMLTYRPAEEDEDDGVPY